MNNNLGQRYVGSMPWLLRVIISSAFATFIIGAIIGAVTHHSPFWKIDAIVFAVVLGIETVFRFAQTRN